MNEGVYTSISGVIRGFVYDILVERLNGTGGRRRGCGPRAAPWPL